jgi:hypothetical protein
MKIPSRRLRLEQKSIDIFLLARPCGAAPVILPRVVEGVKSFLFADGNKCTEGGRASFGYPAVANWNDRLE